ncbi:MAG TPA: class I SAM-dependent methyltransferase [Chloroflexota bacterium]
MSEAVFGPEYAAAYDALYEDKDYFAECAQVEDAFQLHGIGPVRRVLDLGCGTGGHAVILAERGYQVVGVDRSPAMLERARQRASSARFELGEIAGLDLGETFDAVLMMFAVLGYHAANVDVQAALEAVRRHLKPGGLFLCDVWYGPAVLHEGPSERVKVIGAADNQMIRVASGQLDTRHHICTVRYHLWRLEHGQLAAEIREQHRMRYFFPLELEFLLSAARLELIRLGAFPKLEDEPNNDTWNVGVVARAL